MVDVRFELTTNDPCPAVDAICEGISPLGYLRKVNQSPTQTKPYNSCAFLRFFLFAKLWSALVSYLW